MEAEWRVVRAYPPLYGKQMVAVQADKLPKTAVLLGSKRLNAEGFSVHLSVRRSCEVLGGKASMAALRP